MGNKGLLRALSLLDLQLREATKLFNQIFLAAPDVDRKDFLRFADVYRKLSLRTTLYSSNRDLALWYSKRLNSGDRAGYFTPYTIHPAVDTVAVPGFNVEVLGHSYYAKARALINDMHVLMKGNFPPSQRVDLSELVIGKNKLWEFGLPSG
jgi:esterase/lipase superfamily enzyme